MLRSAPILAMCLLGGCLAADPPIYEEPQQVVPQIRTALVDPPTFFVLHVERRTTRTFTVPFVSEDLGDRIWLTLYVDYQLEGEARSGPNVIPAGSLRDVSRQATMLWSVPDEQALSRGCHTVTMIVTHESNYDFDNFRPFDDARAAFVTWWANVDPDENDPQTLNDCPLPEPLAPDTG